MTRDNSITPCKDCQKPRKLFTEDSLCDLCYEKGVKSNERPQLEFVFGTVGGELPTTDNAVSRIELSTSQVVPSSIVLTVPSPLQSSQVSKSIASKPNVLPNTLSKNKEELSKFMNDFNFNAGPFLDLKTYIKVQSELNDLEGRIKKIMELMPIEKFLDKDIKKDVIAYYKERCTPIERLITANPRISDFMRAINKPDVISKETWDEIKTFHLCLFKETIEKPTTATKETKVENRRRKNLMTDYRNNKRQIAIGDETHKVLEPITVEFRRDPVAFISMILLTELKYDCTYYRIADRKSKVIQNPFKLTMPDKHDKCYKLRGCYSSLHKAIETSHNQKFDQLAEIIYGHRLTDYKKLQKDGVTTASTTVSTNSSNVNNNNSNSNNLTSNNSNSSNSNSSNLTSNNLNSNKSNSNNLNTINESRTEIEEPTTSSSVQKYAKKSNLYNNPITQRVYNYFVLKGKLLGPMFNLTNSVVPKLNTERFKYHRIDDTEEFGDPSKRAVFTFAHATLNLRNKNLVSPTCSFTTPVGCYSFKVFTSSMTYLFSTMPKEQWPHHICVIIGLEVYMELLFHIGFNTGGALSLLRTFTLLTPKDYENPKGIEDYIGKVLTLVNNPNALYKWEKKEILNLSYGSDVSEGRTLIIFERTNLTDVGKNQILSGGHKIATAYYHAHKKFRGMPGGCHCLPYETTMDLITLMNLQIGSIFWDIGCGIPVLAAAASAITRTESICTELAGETFEFLKFACKNTIEAARKENCDSVNIWSRIISKKISNEQLEELAKQLYPFTNVKLAGGIAIVQKYLLERESEDMRGGADNEQEIIVQSETEEVRRGDDDNDIVRKPKTKNSCQLFINDTEDEDETEQLSKKPVSVSIKKRSRTDESVSEDNSEGEKENRLPNNQIQHKNLKQVKSFKFV